MSVFFFIFFLSVSPSQQKQKVHFGDMDEDEYEDEYEDNNYNDGWHLVHPNLMYLFSIRSEH